MNKIEVTKLLRMSPEEIRVILDKSKTEDLEEVFFGSLTPSKTECRVELINKIVKRLTDPELTNHLIIQYYGEWLKYS